LYKIIDAKLSEWNSKVIDNENLNMLQHWQYGDAKKQSSSWKIKRFFIIDESESTIAVAQILYRTIPFVGGIARMNRGPVLLGCASPNQNEEMEKKVICSIIKESRRRKWWVIQIAPELLDNEINRKFLIDLGLKKTSATPYASGVISLQAEEELLMGQLNGKWRNCLRKGLKLGVKITKKSGNGNELKILLNRYNKLQNDRGFTGLSDNLITALADQKGLNWEFTLYIANDVSLPNIEECIGMLVSVRHGNTATYLIGSTDQLGRKLQANYVLLWNAILHSKEIGCKWFDIGGLNSTTPKGIAHFKKGLNSKVYGLIGEWRKFIFPWMKY